MLAGVLPKLQDIPDKLYITAFIVQLPTSCSPPIVLADRLEILKVLEIGPPSPFSEICHTKSTALDGKQLTSSR